MSLASQPIDCIDPRADPETRKLLALCSVSTEAVARTFCPDAFSRPFDEGHREIFRALDDDSIQKLLILAPRGIGKTSIVMKPYLLRQILFRLKRHIVPIGATNTMVLNQTESLRAMLGGSNGKIKRMFPSLRSSSRWAKSYWQTEWPSGENGDELEFGTAIFPRGADQPVRGLLQGHYRPDLIVMDDAQNSKFIKNIEYVQELLVRLDTDILFSVDPTWENTKVVYIATILKEYDVPSTLIDREDWKVVFLDLCDDNCNTLWPNILSTEEIRIRQNQARENGTLALWMREARNRITGGELAVFKQKDFKYYNLSDESGPIVTEAELKKPHIINVVIVDPAKTAKSTSNDSAIVGVALDMANERLYFRDIVAAQMPMEQVIDETFSMCERLGATHYAVEVTGLDMFVEQPFQDKNSSQRLGLQFIKLRSKGGPGADGKIGRVGMLAPYFRRGLVWLNSHCASLLEAPLLSYPHSKKWDVMDAAAYAIYVMDELMLYMGGQLKDVDDAKIEADLKEMQAGLEPLDDLFLDDEVECKLVPRM